MVGDILFNLFIMPLELIFEFIFSLTYKWLSNPGVSILFLSLAMNFMVLPLYKRADAIQEEEKNKVNEMAPWVSLIKKAFKGDERYLMLKEFYRVRGYRQISSLRGSFSLILQIPFFIAAYHYLSNLPILNGMKFFIFNDLGAPDALLNFGSFSVNVMPLIMTLINVVSAYVYLRGFPLKDKIQTYGIAAIFLVLLYNSPSGLVFYWTLNQVFSLCKNLVMKLAKRVKKEKREKPVKEVKPFKKRTFFLAAVSLVLLMGLLVPLAVITSSPSEFDTSLTTPAKILVYNLSIAIGFFLIWSGIFYYLASVKGRRVMTYVFWVISVGAVVNYMFFGKNLGTLSNYMIFEDDFELVPSECLINILIAAAIAVILIIILMKLPKVVPVAELILVVAAAGLIAVNLFQMTGSLAESRKTREVNESTLDGMPEDEKVISLSKEGQNVVVLMIDRAMSGYVPYIFAEKPVLEDEFTGFTYYPNTLAFGGHTNFASPPIFGGYEYTPAAMDARSDESLKDKHNNALLLMPRLFSANDFDITVCDLPYGNYKWTSDMSIFQKVPGTEYYTLTGKFSGDYEYLYGDEAVKVQTHNFFMYSFMKVMPLYTQVFLYDDGNYFSTGNRVCIDDTFIDSYSVLCNLENITDIEEGSENNLFMMDNDTTHAITLLSTPDYEPGIISAIVDYPEDAYVIDGKVLRMKTDRQIKHYHVNVAAFLKLGRWFEYLKEQGVWDNTRIIIVSDHGYGLNQFEYMIMQGKLDVQWYNGLLMVKDFNSGGPLVTDNSFMTTADVPTLAMSGIIDDPVDPATKKPVNSDAKNEPQLMTTSHLYSVVSNNGNTFDTSDGKWFSVHDDIFNTDNWEKVKDGEPGLYP